MKAEFFVKDYLKNKAANDADITEKIRTLDESIKSHSADIPLTMADVSFSSSSLLKPEKNCRVREVSDALVRYEDLRRKYYDEHVELMRSKIDYLNLLICTKRIYDLISFLIFKLEPRERRAVSIYMEGGKMAEIASELGCAYNTAKDLLNRGIGHIVADIDEQQLKQIGIG